ncbi:O-antigen ligase family protein [Serratia rubidaea]|uniref:O-antigen ligase n=1 Tax=Serratia rubidaea TaxID=61652 RepID=A0A448S813_SERRU|nr:O-antigen ligase family protein [Serratia rubidaea]MBH1931766.1 O-antigen ligase family protein [Serratia rubidaea]MDC6116833.1 O-antigen ligase family protein [Serratia rubidaea]MEB7587971.1 O-antigen ligase family protein [Serratia rubidaea]VEI63834.1 O-antigen ligase [Serratia rubidaea]
MSKEKIPHPAFSYLIYLGCAIAFCTIPFGSTTGRNIFYISSYIAFIAFCLNFRYLTSNKKNLVLPGLFLGVGLASVLWVAAFKQPGEFIDLYRSYTSTGKLQIATAFILLYALNERLCMQRAFIAVALTTGIVVNIYSLYQGLFLDISRVELNFDRATVVAYLITAINLVMLQAILMLKCRYRLWLYILAFMLTYSTVILTGTRAAMLVYPVVVGISILATKDLLSRRNKLALVTAVPILLIVSGLVFKPQIEQRIADFKTNLQLIDQPQIDNSIISRISMQIVSLKAGTAAPLGESAEKRGDTIRNIIAHEPQLYGVMPYINVHMHNELLETYSIKGVWGVLLLLSLYISLFISAFRPHRNALLLGVTASLFVYGLSDVIFFSTECTVIFCLAIIASVLSGKKKAAIKVKP